MTIGGGKRQRFDMTIFGNDVTTKSVPEEMVEEILSKLPVKSLCQLWCVPKSILTLITNPQFVKLHLNRTQTQRIMVISFKSSTVYCVDLETSLPIFIFNPLCEISYESSLVGICNGLFCLNNINSCDWDDGHFIIYNPSTRESRTLPDFELTASFVFYGFGYAESIDDYMFIKINCEQRKVHFYSLRNNNWTIISDYDCHYPYCLAVYDDWGYSSLPLCRNIGGTSLNGAIHWILAHEDVNKHILSEFDLVQEKFKILPTPNDLLIDCYCTIQVGVLGGCLALMCMLRDSTTYTSEFQVMKEYATGESWTRILTTNFKISIVTMHSIKNPPLYFWWKNNENNRQMVLFDNRRKLILYDANDEAYKHLMNIPADICYNDKINDSVLLSQRNKSTN